MNDYFIWNGTRSTDYGIHVSQMPGRIIPAERETTIKIPGRSGSVTKLEGESVYDDIVLAFTCWIDRESRIDTIIPWLRGNGILVTGNRPDGYYNARIANQISFDKILRGNPQREFTVNFRCNPMFYLNASSAITLTQSGTFLQNIGTIYAEPVLKVTLTADAQISVGSTIFQLQGTTGEITVDTPRLECRKGVLNAGGNMVGSFPVIPKAGAYVNWTGGVSRIVVTPNWRTV